MTETPGHGHNSGDKFNNTTAKELKSLVERVENLLDEKGELMEQIKEVFAEGKGRGFDTKIMRKIISLRAKDRAKLAEENLILQTYALAIDPALAEIL